MIGARAPGSGVQRCACTEQTGTLCFADDVGRIGDNALLALLPINIIAFALSRFVANRVLVSTCAGVIFVLVCIWLLAMAMKQAAM